MKIYLAHALTGAPEGFRQRMFALRQLFNSVSNVSVLAFNWIPGVGPDKTKNTYSYDMTQVHDACLMVGVLDHPSIGLGMEIEKRCLLQRPMRLFYPAGSRVSQIVNDCILMHRKCRLDPFTNRHFVRSELDIVTSQTIIPDPIGYSSDAEIVGCVENLVLRNNISPVARQMEY